MTNFSAYQQFVFFKWSKIRKYSILKKQIIACLYISVGTGSFPFKQKQYFPQYLKYPVTYFSNRAHPTSSQHNHCDNMFSDDVDSILTFNLRYRKYRFFPNIS